MNAIRPVKIVVLDFSGTLSLEMALFAREENLVRVLKESGLWQMGVNSPEIFWTEIVNPTWLEGSTTAKGYKQVIFERVRHLARSLDESPAEEKIWRGVSEFGDRYFDSALIEPAWQKIISDLANRPEVLVMVASDHYAEAAPAIRRQFESLGIEAVSALQADDSRLVLVATSASLGYHKETPDFWEKLKQRFNLKGVSQIVIIDDFGFNEQSFDSYADQQKVMDRMQRTVDMLADLFGANTEAFPFFLRRKETRSTEKLKDDYRELISQAGQFLQKVLDRPKRCR